MAGVPEDSTDILGRRIGAALLDIAALFVLVIVVGLVFGQGQSGGGSVGVRLHGASVVVWALLTFAYYFAPEATSGQTLGKRLLGVRVVGVDGQRPSTGAIAVRTLLRIVDAIPFLYLVGFVVVLATGTRRQRIGDLAAGTTVARA